MPVIRTNSSSSQSALTGIYVGTLATGGQAADVVAIEQVMGLVPLFPCCESKNAVGGFTFGSYDIAGCGSPTSTLDINLNGVDLGNFSFDLSQTPSTVQSAIQALLPSGWICTVTGGGFMRSCIISPPPGLGATGNQALIITKVGTGCGNVFKTFDISGGTDSSSDCVNCDCREGKYAADQIPDDRDFVLPVFADPTCTDSYHNDSNEWMIKYPGTYDPLANLDYQLQELLNGTWTKVASLTDNTYGIAYNNNFFTADGCNQKIDPGKCTNVNYAGYKIDWNKVLTTFGEGTYRFYASGGFTANQPYCFRTPPFCLKTWNCILTSGTIKFETINVGGTFGSVTTQGTSWSLCCTKTITVNNTAMSCSNGITLYDSIRITGYFGYENPESQRDQIKYATGAIKKIRDEEVKTFMARTEQLPMWFHRRFYSYGRMSDYLYVSDYNLNNDSYEYKKFWIVSDGNYVIKHNNSTRYPKAIDFKFKEGQQFVFRDRCCSSDISTNGPTGNGFPVDPTLPTGIPVNPPDTTRLFADLTPHLWPNGHQSAFP